MSDPTPIVLPMFEVLKLGIATAVVNQGLGWLRESRKDRTSTGRDATYLAMRIAVILEGFAFACADSIADNEMYQKHRGHAGNYHGTLPALPEFPADADWKALDPQLASRALSLRNELVASDAAIAFWEDVDRECIPGACDDEAGKCGYRAWCLATELRSRYKLPNLDPKEISWDVVSTLKSHHDKALKELREAAELRAQAEAKAAAPTATTDSQ